MMRIRCLRVWPLRNGLCPFKRTGQRNMRTEGERINEWLAVLRKHGRAGVN